MNKVKILLIAALLLCISFATKADDDRVITYQQLPATAQTFLKTHFGDKTPLTVTADWDEYKIYYQTGEKVEFDRSGNWKEVESYATPVPAALVPAAIKNTLTASFPGTQIYKISRKYAGYEVKLSNGLEVELDNAGRIREIDD